LALVVLAGWAVAATAQSPGPADQSKTALEQTRAQERTEAQAREQIEARGAGPRLVDANADVVCDNCVRKGSGAGQGPGAAQGRQGRGPGDGTGNQGVGPRDGTGRGAGSGSCNGTGQRGRGGRRGRR
jgi:hypothetical protein